MDAEFLHTTVLLQEAVDALITDPDAAYVDGTFGRGGHSRAILSALSPRGRLHAFDRDPAAVAAAGSGDTAIRDPRFTMHHGNFADLLSDWSVQSQPPVRGLLLDLGVSSPQIDNPQRGFSFRFDGPLDMRMDTSQGFSAADYLAQAPAAHIAEVVRDYGEERFAVPIAKAIVAQREAGAPLQTTSQLAQLVARVVRTREPGQDPATRTFQALRIHVNGELEALERSLHAALRVLEPGGRLVVISFHSLEDRRVKQFMQAHSRSVVDRRAPFAEPAPSRLTAVARIKPSAAEIVANPRARSAVLRVATRTEVPA